MRTKYNFVASAAASFPPITPLDELINAIGNRFGTWEAEAANVTEVNGRVAEWIADGGRKFEQVASDRRPYLEGGGLRMFNADTLAPESRMVLAGTQIGQRTNLTIAAKFKLLASSLETDLHYLFGDQSVNTRLMYRHVPGGAGKLLRFDVNGNAVDVAVPEANTGQMGVVIEVAGTTLRMTTSWGGQAQVTLPASGINLPALYIGNSSTSGGGDMPGWFEVFGAWTGMITKEERSALLAKVS